MNEITNKFLLAEDKLMSEIHLKQPGFSYSVCGPFTKKLGKLDVDRLARIPVVLSKLSDTVKNHIFKKDEYNTKIKNTEDKIPGITSLGTNTTLIAKIDEVQNETPSITNLATNASEQFFSMLK